MMNSGGGSLPPGHGHGINQFMHSLQPTQQPTYIQHTGQPTQIHAQRQIISQNPPNEIQQQQSQPVVVTYSSIQQSHPVVSYSSSQQSQPGTSYSNTPSLQSVTTYNSGQTTQTVNYGSHQPAQPGTSYSSSQMPVTQSLPGASSMYPATPALPMTPMTPATPVSDGSGIVPQLQNIVSTVNLGCKLDLKKIALHARNAEYNPKRFAAVIMRIREPRTTALIFSSGKMVCTGAKSEDFSRLAARKYARVIQKLGFPAKFLDFKIQNMVGSCDVKFPIRLEGLVLTHGQFSSYEPELFPGLIYRMVKPRIVLLIFVSGKVVLTGAKVRKEIYEAFENIYPILKAFKKMS